jgi:hypothetical protein
VSEIGDEAGQTRDVAEVEAGVRSALSMAVERDPSQAKPELQVVELLVDDALGSAVGECRLVPGGLGGAERSWLPAIDLFEDGEPGFLVAALVLGFEAVLFHDGGVKEVRGELAQSAMAPNGAGEGGEGIPEVVQRAACSWQKSRGAATVAATMSGGGAAAGAA